MFTGLIEGVGSIAVRVTTPGGVRLRIATTLADELAPGDSLAVNGVCLTVAAASAAEVSADLGPETLRVTTLGGLAEGTAVNLERPLRSDTRLGGHFVQGHVDAVGRIEALRPHGDCVSLSVSYPKVLARFIVAKGSIALDGISLTVAALHADRFDVQVVPFTLEHTNLKSSRPGDFVNLEGDLVGKYVVRSMELRIGNEELGIADSESLKPRA